MDRRRAMIESEITAAAKSMRDSCMGARRVKTWSSGVEALGREVDPFKGESKA